MAGQNNPTQVESLVVVRAAGLTHKYWTKLTKVLRVDCCNLFFCGISDKEKYYLNFFLHYLQWGKTTLPKWSPLWW